MIEYVPKFCLFLLECRNSSAYPGQDQQALGLCTGDKVVAKAEGAQCRSRVGMAAHGLAALCGMLGSPVLHSGSR